MDGQLSLFDDNDPPRWEPSGKRIVYFIECGKFIKIGFTSRTPEERLREHSTGNPNPMHIIGSITVGDDENDRDLHRRFAKFHAHGEWFHNKEELRIAIVKTINRQRLTTPAPIHPPPERNQPFLFFLNCPECKCLISWQGHVSDGPLADDVFGRVICPRCGIQIPMKWGAVGVECDRR